MASLTRTPVVLEPESAPTGGSPPRASEKPPRSTSPLQDPPATGSGSEPCSSSACSGTGADDGRESADWSDLSALAWRESLYGEGKTHLLNRLFQDELKVFTDLNKQDVDSKKYSGVSIVEVGCGTAELFSKLHEKYSASIGIEISADMIELAYSVHPQLRAKKGKTVFLAQGNAIHLTEGVQGAGFPPEHEFWSPTHHRTVCILMNTLGILPAEIRTPVLQQMMQVAGPGGRVVIVCWYKPKLRDGFTEYYSQNPGLCGEAKEEYFDFESGDFYNPVSTYRSHWYDQADLEALLLPIKPASASMKFQVIGGGIFCFIDMAPVDASSPDCGASAGHGGSARAGGGGPTLDVSLAGPPLGLGNGLTSPSPASSRASTPVSPSSSTRDVASPAP